MAPHATTNDENNSRTVPLQAGLPVALPLFLWESGNPGNPRNAGLDSCLRRNDGMSFYPIGNNLSNPCQKSYWLHRQFSDVQVRQYQESPEESRTEEQQGHKKRQNEERAAIKERVQSGTDPHSDSN
jgi:hypothetical protein